MVHLLDTVSAEAPGMRCVTVSRSLLLPNRALLTRVGGSTMHEVPLHVPPHPKLWGFLFYPRNCVEVSFAPVTGLFYLHNRALLTHNRFRFTSPHPKDFPLDLLSLIAERGNICSHTHTHTHKHILYIIYICIYYIYIYIYMFIYIHIYIYYIYVYIYVCMYVYIYRYIYIYIDM
jgi:hypothetical protein